MEFAYHRSIAPMMWAFVTLASVELLVVHLFLALKWPAIAWPLSALTFGSILWFVALIRSFKRRPHRLEGGRLLLSMGRLRSIEVPMGQVKAVRPVGSAADIKPAGTANLALIAHPNRLIDLEPPIERKGRRISRIALVLDDPAAFDLAMRR